MSLSKSPKCGKKEYHGLDIEVNLIKPKKRKTLEEKDANSSVKQLISISTNNGLSPYFGDRQPEQFNVKHPSLSFLTFRVLNSERKEELLGQCTIPFNMAKTGLVSVPLLNSYSEKISDSPCAALLINFRKTNPNNSKSKIIKNYSNQTNDETTVKQLAQLDILT